MKNWIIGAVVAAVILFIWQFLSWSVIDLHYEELSYTYKQAELIEALNELNLEEGHYFIPRAPRSASVEEANAAATSNSGKPWARVSYHQNMQFSYTNNFLRGFITDLFAASLLVWILLQLATLNMKSAILTSVGINVFGFATIPYLNAIWLEVPAIAYLIDGIVSGVLAGAWLGWWLPGHDNRRSSLEIS